MTRQEFYEDMIDSLELPDIPDQPEPLEVYDLKYMPIMEKIEISDEHDLYALKKAVDDKYFERYTKLEMMNIMSMALDSKDEFQGNPFFSDKPDRKVVKDDIPIFIRPLLGFMYWLEKRKGFLIDAVRTKKEI